MTTPTQSIDALTARTQFGKIIEKAVKGKTRFLVSRRGKPTVVILGVEDYMEHFIKKPTFLVEIQKQAVRAGLDAMTDREINNEIKAARGARRM
jgi:prevent-host-death family protein